jgi:hypothetical protein
MDYTGISIYRPLRTWSYGFDGSDQTHNGVLNFTYNLPNTSRRLNNNKFVKWIFDDWTLAGIAQWVSGTPASIGLSTVQGTDLTGGGDGQRLRSEDGRARLRSGARSPGSSLGRRDGQHRDRRLDPARERTARSRPRR